MNSFPLVSVGIVTYNQKQYLKECIESVFEQDYPNIEIVVGDDGSTDGTQNMLLEYKTKYPNIQVILSPENQGVTANSNKVHFACNGKYIAWMGGDDLMLPGKISKQVQFMESRPECDICYHDLEVFHSDSGKSMYKFSQKNRPREGDVRVSIRYGTFNGACSTMVRKAKTPHYGFHPLIPVASDWLYWVETLISGGEIYYIDEVLGKYRRHHNNITKKSNTMQQSHIDHLNSCNIIISKYPQYFQDVMYRYSRLLFHFRQYLPYISTLFLSFRMYPNWKSIAGMTGYLLTGGKYCL